MSSIKDECDEEIAEDLGLRVATQDEAFWLDIQSKSEKSIQTLKDELRIQELIHKAITEEITLIRLQNKE